MPEIAANNSPPSTLADVVQQVKDAFGAVGNPTPILVGKQYLAEGVGSPPRVVFVPEPRGKIDRAAEMGMACSIVHSCEVYVRGVEGVDDVARFSSAYALADLVIDYLATAAVGRITFGDYADGSPTDADAFGAEVAFSFQYQRDVRHDPARWALAAADADAAAVPAVPPQGTAADSVALDLTTDPTE